MITKILDSDSEKKYQEMPIQDLPYEFKSETNSNRKIIADSRMGSGGFGITYKCRYCTRMGIYTEWEEKEVVIKEFFIHGTSQRSVNGVSVYVDGNFKDDEKMRFMGYLRRFEDESKNLAALKKGRKKLENIVDVIHSFSSNGTSYYVMEYISGMELLKYIKERGTFVSFEEAWRYFRPICVALSIIHSSNIAHRDIQPRNILVQMNKGDEHLEKLVLIDFGNCKYYNEDECLTRVAPAGFTPFSPPELREKKDLSIEEYKVSDIYSLGAVLFFVFTGIFPPEVTFSSNDLNIPDNISSQIAEIIKKAMMPAIKDRYQSVQAFIDACDRALVTTYDADTILNISPLMTLGELQHMESITVSIPADDKTMNSKAILNRTWKEIIVNSSIDNYKVGDLNFKRVTLKAEVDASGCYQLTTL